MSKHVGRKQRWTRQDDRRYSSPLGQVFYEQNGWYALLDYRTLAAEGEGGLPVWVAHRTRLGPFKRPRNAMVALEREVTVLRNRHGENLLLAGQLWGEAQA
jgi:hypothetical protein